MRELVTVQLGQCGNQIGRQFWQQALAEHAQNCDNERYDAAMSAFFRNVDARVIPPRDLGLGSPISALRARAVLVDMEEGPVAETLRSPIGELFESHQYITDVSGSGNNWAHGHALYGPQYAEPIRDAVRATLEKCDSPQSFFVLHSMGGGTGSGLGTYVLRMLEDDFPTLFRFNVAVFPSEDDDVVTSPYNATLALAHLTDASDCVIPVENQALQSIVARADAALAGAGASPGAAGGAADARLAGGAGAGGFDAMNGVAAHMLTHLTAGVRFSGELNVDLNEISTNLVPFPRVHYLTASLSPLPAAARAAAEAARADVKARHPRQVRRFFTDAFAPQNMLIRAEPRKSTYLACALLLRGDVAVSDVSAALAQLQPELRMAHWNPEAFKVGLCAVPPIGAPRGLLCLANNCGVRETFSALHKRFCTLYHRRAMVHHYAQYTDAGVFDEALQSLEALIADYDSRDRARAPPEPSPRLVPLF